MPDTLSPLLDTEPAPSERPRKKRRLGLIFLLIALMLLAGMGLMAARMYGLSTAGDGPRRPLVVRIPFGATGSDVASLLEDHKVIQSAFIFKLLARIRGVSQSFQAGKYHLRTNMSASEAIEGLEEGPFVESLEVTIPEGYVIPKTAARIQRALGIKARRFERAALSGRYSLPPYLPKGTKTVEGFLFPSTYEFLKDSTADDVIRRLLGQFQQEARGLPWDHAKARGLSPYEAVVLASMIEREARVPADRPKVATVIYNRLKQGMLLQIDATVQYALGKQKEGLTYEDLKVESPYNTYLHAGLPPTPISSPGLASLRAALNPVKACWLYFVVVGEDGRHGFTCSYQEFLRMKEKAAG